MCRSWWEVRKLEDREELLPGAFRSPLKSSGVSRARGRGLGGALGVGSTPKNDSSSLAELEVEVPSGDTLEGGEEGRAEGELERRERVVEPLLMGSWRSGGRTETPSSRVRCEGEPIGWKKLLVLLFAR